MARFNLPDDAWAELYEAKKIPERVRRPIQRAGLAYQRMIPEKFSAKVTVGDPVPEAEPEAEATSPEVAAFGAPPVEQIAAQAAADPLRLRDLSDEALVALDRFNDAIVLGYTKEWSFGDVTADVLVELPSDAFDALLTECQRLNQNKSEKKGDESEDPTEPS